MRVNLIRPNQLVNPKVTQPIDKKRFQNEIEKKNLSIQLLI
jgi:hypothetical protein